MKKEGSAISSRRPANPSDADVALVLKAYEAFAAGDIDSATVALHPDVEWIEPDEFPNGGRRVGPASVAEYLTASRAMWSELTSERTPYRHGDDIVIIHRVYGMLADGTPNEATVADVFTVRDGQVVKMQAYADPEEAFKS
ncbi:nuclear transport factor 2 family protein [Spirillospora sp. NPDC048911]|uniref:nuclear transport factor 2 family protein n=1 Tax=Spirillospora sp. NPDC048911 TaxID=3364527 RepID=UPI0037215DAF